MGHGSKHDYRINWIWNNSRSLYFLGKKMPGRLGMEKRYSTGLEIIDNDKRKTF
jgi:ribosomal protein L3